jgi:hypothetical protein
MCIDMFIDAVEEIHCVDGLIGFEDSVRQASYGTMVVSHKRVNARCQLKLCVAANGGAAGAHKSEVR